MIRPNDKTYRPPKKVKAPVTYHEVRFPKRSTGKIAKLRADPIHGGNRVTKTTTRARKHEVEGSTNCKMCGGVYHVGEYYEHTKTTRHVRRLYR